jgi:trk system potassium uptake protein TrkH
VAFFVAYGVVVKVLGELLALEALMMLPAWLIAVFLRQQDAPAFLASMLAAGAVGLAMSRAKAGKGKIKVKEGLAIVALGWLLISVFGALPFVLSGSIPSFVDAFFETVSGFTTTGATLVDDVEALPQGILFWRSFTHWIGGMGILVFTVALLPALGVGGFQIFKAESPGPVADKIVPKIKDTAKILYTTYIAITLIQIVLLRLGGMSLYEAALNTFGTVGTGGFSTRNASIGAYDSVYLQMVIAFFMVLSGINFSLYFSLYQGKWRDVFKNEELRLYLGIIMVSAALISLNIASEYDSFGLALKDSFFQTGSLITTTGFATTNYDLWPTFSKAILFLLMFVGASAGSTGGGIKSIRILVLFKLIRREISKIFHPRGVIPVKVNQKVVNSDQLSGITSFFVLYMLIFVLGTIAISLEGIDLISAASAVVSALSNIGPGFGVVGPSCTFSGFSDLGTLFLAGLMLLGRLELFTIVALLAPKAWRNEV